MSLSSVIDRVVQLAAGVPRDIAQLHVFLAAVDVCERTAIWQVTHTFESTDDTQFYDITPVSGARPVGVVAAFAGDIPLRGVNRLNPPSSDVYRGFDFDKELSRIRLHDTPKSGTKYRFVLYYAPAESSTIPRVLHTDNSDLLVDGAASRLLFTPNRPYTNLRVAQLHGRRFKSGVGRLKRQQMTSDTIADVGWRFPLVTRSRGYRR